MKRCSILLLLLMGISICLSACAKDDDKLPSLSMINVQLTFDPETVQVGKAVTLQALVTQDGKAVEDADEVLFEIRAKGADESEQMEGSHERNGLYTLQKTFAQEGDYYVTAHVTARSMHNMPTQVLTVTK